MSYKPWKLWRVRALSKLRTLYGSGQLTLGACYFKYDTDFPYVPQVEAHIELAKIDKWFTFTRQLHIPQNQQVEDKSSPV